MYLACFVQGVQKHLKVTGLLHMATATKFKIKKHENTHPHVTNSQLNYCLSCHLWPDMLIISTKKHKTFFNCNKYYKVIDFTWYLTLKPLHPWNVAPGNEERINESIRENFSLANHHSENIGNGMPPTQTQIVSKKYQDRKWLCWPT